MSTARNTNFCARLINSREGPYLGRHQFVWGEKGKKKKKAQQPAGFEPKTSRAFSPKARALPLCCPKNFITFLAGGASALGEIRDGLNLVAKSVPDIRLVIGFARISLVAKKGQGQVNSSRSIRRKTNCYMDVRIPYKKWLISLIQFLGG